jgi:hypothetical protein
MSMILNDKGLPTTDRRHGLAGSAKQNRPTFTPACGLFQTIERI